jgi:protein-L-isoaspartate(D-aspartate) O-methyltransferase
MDFEQARLNMVASQVRTWDVLDQSILDLLMVVKREDFVPDAYRDLAFADTQIPIGHGEFMLHPKLEARLVQSVTIKPDDKVLEVGTGTGYTTALLAHLAREVISVEIIPEFATAAMRRLRNHSLNNVTVETGDAAAGWARSGPYDVILLTGSVPILPDEFKNQLAEGGRLLAVIGNRPAMTATLITRLQGQAFSTQTLFETDIPALKNARQPQKFVF